MRRFAKNEKALSCALASIILIAATIALSISVTAWAGSLTAGFMNNGTLAVKIKDKPAELANLYVTVSDFAVHNADQDSWIDLGVTATHFDLLTLQDKTLDLSQVQIQSGHYNKIRLTIEAASCTFKDEVEETTLTVPPDHIDIIINAQITAGTTTQVVIDIQPDTISISQTLNLKPVIKAEVTQVTPTPSTSPPSTSPVPSPSA
jgi:hypothetical protein